MEKMSRLLLGLLVVASLVAVPPAAANNSAQQQFDTKGGVLDYVGNTDPASATPDATEQISQWTQSNEGAFTQAEYVRVRQWVIEVNSAQSLGIEVPPEPGEGSSSTPASTTSSLRKGDVMEIVRQTEPADASTETIREVGNWVATRGPDRLTVNEYEAAYSWVQQATAATNAQLDEQLPTVGDVRGQITQEAPETESELTFEQLSPRGDRPSENAPTGVRAGGPYSEYGIQTLPTQIWALPFEGNDSPLWSFMSSGATVKRNKIKFATNRPRSMDGVNIEDQNYTLHIAYWQQESRIVEENNQTREVTYATNISTVSRTYAMGDGRDEQIVPLRPHYDDATEVTVCVETDGEGADCLADPGSNRFRFTHASNNAYEVLPATSQGRRTMYAFGLVGITVLTTLVTLFGVRKLLDRALASPKVSLLVWLILGIIGVAGVFLVWNSIVEMFVLRPFLVAVPVGIFLGVVVAEWFGDSTYLAAAIRFRLDEVKDPGQQVDHGELDVDETAGDGADLEDHDAVPGATDDSDSAEGVMSMDIVPMRMVQHEDGRAAASEGGLPFLARARGARADVETDGNPLTRIEVNGGPYDEAFLLDPESDEPIDHDPEGHRWHIPMPISREKVEREDGTTVTRWETNIKPYVLGIGALAAGWVGGALLFTNGLLGIAVSGLLVTLLGVLKPDPGHLKMDLAPLHYHTAVGTMIQHASKLGDAKSWQSMYEEIKREKGRNRAEEKSLQDRGARSQAEAISEEYVADEPDYTDTDPAGNGHQEVTSDDD